MDKKVYVNAVRFCFGNVDVYTSDGIYEDVHANVVRCMLGSDMNYLLKANVNGTELFRPLSEKEIEDLVRYKMT